MTWFKVDDKLHDHRKTRKALRIPGKRRDAAAMGLWSLAGSWSADNLTDGFVPSDELHRWDDAAEQLAERLVTAGYWAPEVRDGEDGFQFINWPDHQPTKAEVERKREAARDRMRSARANGGKGSSPVRANSAGTCGEVRSTPSRPVPTRPAAAAAAEGDTAAAAASPILEVLRSKLQAHTALRGLRFDTLSHDQVTELEQLVQLHGDEVLVRVARDTCRNPAPTYVTAFLGTWRALPAPGTRLRVIQQLCDIHQTVLSAGGVCSACASEEKAADR